MRRGDDCIVSGQKLCQILTPALLAAQRLLSFHNKKFIRLAALLTTVFINRHNFLLYVCRRQHPVCRWSTLFVSLKLVLVPASSLMGTAGMIHGKLLKLILT